MVEFRAIDFKYPSAQTNAISDVSFSIEPGQTVAVVGGSAGKSTLVKLLANLPTSGEILLDGQNVTDIAWRITVNSRFCAPEHNDF